MLYSVDELAQALNKNPETIRRWCRSGKVKCIKDSNKGGWTIDYTPMKDDLECNNTDWKDAFKNMARVFILEAIEDMNQDQLKKTIIAINNILKGS